MSAGVDAGTRAGRSPAREETACVASFGLCVDVETSA
jgi:hypothetical protein